MLRPRIIPCLLVKDGALFKTVRFGEGKYVGDPINAVRIFNEKEVDELIVLDIDATVKGQAPNYDLIRKLAAECRMPLCYGGGIKTVEQIQDIISLGVEKVALSAAAVENPELITAGAQRVGSQSIVTVMDVKKTGNGYEVYTHNGCKPAGLSPLDFARKMEGLGAGEIVINAIDRDGTMEGYDLDLASQVRDVITLPLTVLGGAGSLKDVAGLVDRFGIVGAAAGSLFVFKGIYRAVLISYPNCADKDALVWSALAGAV